MTEPTLEYETVLWQQGYAQIVGLDEVGRGCWAGPVVAGAVVLSPTFNLEGAPVIRDSKTLSALQRQRAVAYLGQASEVKSAIGQASVEEINKLGIAAASFLAMQRAAEQLNPDFILIDGFNHPTLPQPQQAIIRGDSLSISIAAASIIAKEYRDNMMNDLSVQYPNYDLDQHKGYGTKAHQQAIQTYGLSPIHRQFNLKFLSTT